MARGAGQGLAARLQRVAGFARRPELLAFLPAATLAAFWYGGEGALVVTAFLVPAAYALAGILGGPAAPALRPSPRDGTTGLPLREAAVAALDRALAEGAASGRATACLVLCLAEADDLLARQGHAAFARILRRTGERLESALRRGDCVARLDGAAFAVALAAVARADLEAVLQIAARLLATATEPHAIDAATVHVDAAVGFCLGARAPAPGGAALLAAAEAAADAARRHGPGAIRAFTPEMAAATRSRSELRAELARALDEGRIVPFFQPQVSTDTGEVTGFEALARWVHPARGILPPGDFLDAVLAEGLSERLGEIVLFGALGALRAWDMAGLAVPAVAVNLAAEELANPRLAARIGWELDRFDLAPGRLTVEILETVAARSGEDVVVQTVAGLARLGCGIDLDDFGTGQASIGAIRRFGVGRIKIDRSFVARLDVDPEQQRLVTAILSFAERMGLGTVAEGVETAGEHARLAELGCGHVQGYAIARPMPFEETAGWIAAHRARLAAGARLAAPPAPAPARRPAGGRGAGA